MMHLPKSEQIVVARHDPARSAFPQRQSRRGVPAWRSAEVPRESPPRERVAKGKSTRLMLFGRESAFGQCPGQAARPLAHHNPGAERAPEPCLADWCGSGS
jgi:hypothetical protein